MAAKWSAAWILATAAAVTVSIGGTESPTDPTYELVDVKREVVREEPAPEVDLERGAALAAGDLVRTGSRSAAEILAREAASRFRLGPKTRARLASGRPGVLLEIDKGRLHAVFDALTGVDRRERLVVTPSAVLAVRGTEYGVEVDRKGNSTVTVFEGVVNVTRVDGLGETVRVQAGQYSEIRRGKPPRPPERHDLKPSEWERGARPDRMDQGPVGGDPMPGGAEPGGMGSGGADSGSSGGSRGSSGGGRGGGRG
jgi:hypothetical protein